MSMEKGSNFIKGAVILSLAGIIAKVMGFVYRIVLPRILGEYGLGLYEVAYSIYVVLLVISRSGIPVAIAKMIADRIARDQRKNAFKIFKVGRKASVIVGIIFMFLMIVLARPLIHLFKWNSDVLYSLLALAPAIFFVSIMAVYRGFFQGLQDMVPTACSQVVEQFVRMVTMIALVYILVPYGVQYGAAGAVFGAVTGSIAGLLVLFYIYYKKRKKIWKFVNTDSVEDINQKNIIKEIASLGIPISFGGLVLPLMRFVDASIIPSRLEFAGFSSVASYELLAHMNGMAMVLVNFPTIITIALAASLVPAISESFAQNNKKTIKRRTETALRLTILIGLPAAVGLFVLAEPLTVAIFNTGKAAVPLRIVSWGVIFITLQQTSAAILQGLEKPLLPARNLFLGAVINGVINFTLTGLPAFGIRGAAVGTLTGFAFAAFWNIYYLKKYTDFKFRPLLFVLKPVLSVLVMGIVVSRGFILLQNLFSVFVSSYYSYRVSASLIVFIGSVAYFFILVLLNAVKYSDLMLIPKVGPKLADILKKVGLVADK